MDDQKSAPPIKVIAPIPANAPRAMRLKLDAPRRARDFQIGAGQLGHLHLLTAGLERVIEDRIQTRWDRRSPWC